MREEKAVEYKHSGNNCCQSVLLAFADRLDLPEETLRRLGSGMGMGMGTKEGVCGALNAAALILGLCNDGTRKPLSVTKEAQGMFREKSGAILCRELRGEDIGTPRCPCDDCVRHAVQTAEALLEQQAGRA